MTSREGYDAYCLYLAVNNHFNTDSYDYFKYAGKTSVKLETFLKRKDKYHFAKLARKYHVELLDFYVANLSRGKFYVKNLLDILHTLVDEGNTVIVIEHNLDVIKTADHIIDLGPEGGKKGGSIIFQGMPEDIIKSKKSFTGMYLKNYI